MVDTAAEPNERYKVGRVISEYGLSELHEELPERWLGDGCEPHSLRELAEEINIAVLHEAMESPEMQPLDGEVENAYRLLTGGEVSSGMRIAKRNELERDGINVDSIEKDFVSHQAVHTYLTEALDVSKQKEDEDDLLEKHSERISRLRSRTEAVAGNSLDSLTNNGALKISDPEVSVSIQVYCHQCNRQYPFSSLTTQGGCDCMD